MLHLLLVIRNPDSVLFQSISNTFCGFELDVCRLLFSSAKGSYPFDFPASFENILNYENIVVYPASCEDTEFIELSFELLSWSLLSFCCFLRSRQFGDSSSSSLWRLVRGGTSGTPLGHAPYPESSTSDGILSFDTSNYRHRPLDGAVAVGPVVNGEEEMCLGFWYYIATAVAVRPKIGTL